MVGDAGDDVGEVGLDIEAAHLRRLDDGVEGGGASPLPYLVCLRPGDKQHRELGGESSSSRRPPPRGVAPYEVPIRFDTSEARNILSNSR
jgi:hypothetical protein